MRHHRRPGGSNGLERLEGFENHTNLPVVTKATLPAATPERQGRLYYVSDGTSGHVVVCNGASYEYMAGGAV